MFQFLYVNMSEVHLNVLWKIRVLCTSKKLKMFFVNVGFVIECIFFEYRHLLEQYLNWLCEVNILSWFQLYFLFFKGHFYKYLNTLSTDSVVNLPLFIIFENNYLSFVTVFFDLFNDSRIDETFKHFLGFLVQSNFTPILEVILFAKLQ